MTSLTRFDPRRVAATLAMAGVIVLVAACSSSGAAPAASVAAPAVSNAPSAAASGTTGGGRYGSGGDYGSKPSASATASAGASASASAAAGGETYEVDKASGSVGAYLTGEGGMTLYTLKNDSADTSTCAGTCVTNWPPFTSADEDTLKPGSGVGGKLTTFARADGTKQVAYNGKPLYYFSGDSAAGDTNGQGVKSVWYVAAP